MPENENASENRGYELAPASGTADSLCVMFHGYGADGSDMIGVASVMQMFLPNTHFVAPNGPESCDTAPGFYQWYSIGGGREMADLAATMLTPRLNHYIDLQLERLSLTDRQLILFGFSQGGGIMIDAALRRPEPCAALLSYTSALRNRDKIADEITARPRTMLVHGDLDEVLPIRHLMNTVDLLTSHDIDVSYHICTGIGHTLNEEGALVGANFIAQILYPEE